MGQTSSVLILCAASRVCPRILEVPPVAPALVMAVLRGQYNARSDFLFSTPPLIPPAPYRFDSELIVPQIAVVGGCTTSFIFMNNGNPVSVLLRTESPSGRPLNLTYE